MIEAFVFIPPGICIGNNVFIGPHTVFTNHKHPENRKKAPFVPEITIVQDNVTIGANCTIGPNITLRRGCTIGMGSVVTGDISEKALAYGNPAREVPFT